MTEHIERYRDLKSDIAEIINAVFEKSSSTRAKPAARYLGILDDNTLLLDAEQESSLLMDFVSFEFPVDGKTGVQEFFEIENANDRYVKYGKPLLQARTALLTITESDSEKCILVAFNNETKEEVILVDIALSKSFVDGTVVFTRLITIDDITISPGAIMFFERDTEQHLLWKSKKIMKKLKSGTPLQKRYYAFFHLNRSEGIESATVEI